MDKRKRRLLCMLEGSGRKSRWVRGVPPLSFKAKKAGTLENYRIYGNTVGGESVGDLVESGEHAGEYKVPVTVEGKNLLQNTATSRIVNDVIFTVNDDGSVTCNGTAKKDTAYLIKKIDLYEANYILTGCPEGGTRSTYSMQYTNNVDSAKVDYGEGVFFTPYNSEQYSDIAAIVFIATGYTCNNLTFHPMIRKADIADDTYEPYHAPVTTPIYLPEPIKMVGDEAEYVDYEEQKQYFADGTSTDVTLPVLPTLPGTNTLSVGTEVQPTRVDVKGRVKTI